MHQNGGEDEWCRESGGVDAATKAEVAGYPGKDSQEDGFLVAEFFQHDGQEKHEDDVRNLRKGHL